MEDKIKISTKEELLNIKKNGNYVLMNDIDLDEHGDSLIDKFEGQFDGQGHTIRNYKIIGQGANTGLFNAVIGENARISNLVIENASCYSYADKRCGIITGFLFDGATIENCTVKSSNTIARYPYRAGLICGEMNDYDTKHPTYIRNCNVIGCTTGASAIAGRVYYSVVENCIVDNCELTTHFAGLVFDAMKSRIENCFIKNSKLFDKSGIIIYKSNSTRIINTELIVPPVVTNEMLMKSILESADSYEQLKDREEISLWGVYTDEPVDFPEVITKLSKLKKLNIGNNSWRTIPDGITKLKNLEELQLDCALSYIDSLPDLSALPKLKTLRANGNVWHSKHPFPKQSLLPQILKSTQVEVLDISKWGERVRQAKVVRPQIDMELFNGLKTFKNLQILLLSGNTFESLPKVLNSLNPEYIDLSDNRLPPNESLALKKNLPETVINFENNKPRKAVDNLNDICQYGAQLIMDYSNSESLLKSIDVFDKVIESASQGVYNDNPFTVQYAYYGKLYAYIFLTANHKSKLGDKKKHEEAVQTMLDMARQVVDLVRENPEILHYSALASLQADMIRRATNTLGWHAYKNSKNSAELEEAIELTEWGTEYIENTEHFYVYDTLVRLLIKAGRKTEAYEIVKSTLREYPAFNDFADFKSNKQYNNWLKEN